MFFLTDPFQDLIFFFNILSFHYQFSEHLLPFIYKETRVLENSNHIGKGRPNQTPWLFNNYIYRANTDELIYYPECVH